MLLVKHVFFLTLMRAFYPLPMLKKPHHVSSERSKMNDGQKGQNPSRFDREHLDFANRFEDRELRLLEKDLKLKKNKKKLPNSFVEDGLDCKHRNHAVNSMYWY